jgi:CheY-like chemotaxis protein
MHRVSIQEKQKNGLVDKTSHQSLTLPSDRPDEVMVAAGELSAATSFHTPPPLQAGTEGRIVHVLLVEDEPLIRMNSADMLTDLGFKVDEAGSVHEALSVLERGSVDVLIADIGLPDGSGLDLAVRALTRQPKLKVVFATGHASVPGADELVPAYRLLCKPYDIAGLRQVLD